MHLLSSIYDTFGHINHIVVSIKTCFQQLCGDKLSLDDIITGDSLTQWNKILESLKRSPDFVVARPDTCRKAKERSFLICTIMGFLMPNLQLLDVVFISDSNTCLAQLK